jgi:Ribbon-helix-helix protein, copG family
MATIKMTFSLDEATATQLDRTAATLGRPKSRVVRDAILEYASRADRLSDAERRRLLGAFDELVPAIPAGSVADVEAELEALRAARRRGGRAASRP